MYKYFHCLTDSLVWGADFTFEEFGIDGEGIVHELTCANCGAEVLYFIDCNDEEEGE